MTKTPKSDARVVRSTSVTQLLNGIRNRPPMTAEQRAALQKLINEEPLANSGLVMIHVSPKKG